MESVPAKSPTGYLNRLGVYGFSHIEPIIIAALVSEDPILLIGKAGTGKTFLLNSISEAMRLEHRHYNASQISFDDLIGFPYPETNGQGIRFLPTPATIWDAESVLVDELNRCKPEIQNKFFSVIHERRIHGMPVSKLLYRWAAMNPFHFSASDQDEHYEGCEPLDPALSDRFAFLITVPDWHELSDEDQSLVIHPAGEAAISNDGGSLLDLVHRLKPRFRASIQAPLPEVTKYAQLATSLMGKGGLRISPRRARMLARNMTALLVVADELQLDLSQAGRERLYRTAITWSLPHRAYLEQIPNHLIDSVHAEASRIIRTNAADAEWTMKFRLSPTLADKAIMLLGDDVDRDVKSIAVMQLLSAESPGRAEAFAIATAPALLKLESLNTDTLQEVIKLASDIMEINGTLQWNEQCNLPKQDHPAWAACQEVLENLDAKKRHRNNRARQLFLYLILKHRQVPDPGSLEIELDACFRAVQTFI
jgi:MoxR-like ATPase